MEKIKQYKYLVIIVAVILGGVFYWFQLRPSMARKTCITAYPSAFNNTSVGRVLSYKASLDKAGYEKCLREHGLNN